MEATGQGQQPAPVYARVYAVVAAIPAGRVATYGQIAAIVGGCTARMVGFAMAAAPDETVAWHRVINAQGKISLRADSAGAAEQRHRLEEEGVRFDDDGRVALSVCRWEGPDLAWLLNNGFDPEPSWTPDTGERN